VSAVASAKAEKAPRGREEREKHDLKMVGTSSVNYIAFIVKSVAI
jgi:hypothetical protein